VLSAWGLRTGDDVGAIVHSCVEAGWLKAGPDDRPEDFHGVVLPGIAPPKVGLLGWRSTSGRQSQQYGRPVTTAGELRRWAVLFCARICFGIGLAFAATAGYVWWAERLSPEERALVGRWYDTDDTGAVLRFLELRPDRVCRMQALRRGEVAVAAQRNTAGRWAVRDQQIVIVPPPRGFRDRITWAFGRVPKWMEIETTFQTRDADTLVTNIGGRPMVQRRVPPGLASDAQLFNARPANVAADGP